MTTTLKSKLETLAMGPSDRVVLRVDNLSKEFLIHERGICLKAFQSVSFCAQTGELLALVGSSGAGKSSVLKCIYRTYLATSGSAFYRRRNGEVCDLTQINNSEMLELRRNEIRIVSQFLRVLPRRSARQVLEHTLRTQDPGCKGARDFAEHCLERVGLPRELWDLPPNTFSGGEKQLVNLAQALAIHPRLLLLDEPTASLDPISTDKILGVIDELKSPEIAIVGVFHDRSIIARLADQQVVLDGGLTNDTNSN